jgi:hypothetical protein
LSITSFDAPFIEGVSNGRQGVERLPISEASSSYSYGALENKNGCPVAEDDKREGKREQLKTRTKKDQSGG